MTETHTAGELAVEDLNWANDYDIFNPHFVRDPYPVWAKLRQQEPVPHTARWGGSWMPTRYADIQAIAHDSEHFSSVEITVVPIPFTYDEHGNRRRSIIATDPPDHAPERRIFLPFFSPKATFYGSVGRTVSRLDANGSSLSLGAGVSFGFQHRIAGR